MTDPEIVTPVCIGCGSEPSDLSQFTWPTQAWCEVDACEVLTWNATLTAEQNRAQAKYVDLTGLRGLE
jgi:hypothetical protein